jgi:hypothetical protein
MTGTASSPAASSQSTPVSMATEPIRTIPVRRLEAWSIFALAAAVCLRAGLEALHAGTADLDALAALSHALDVLHKDPRFNLALIGFGNPPLTALLYLPLGALSTTLATSGLACPLLGCLLFGGCAVLLNYLSAQEGLSRWIRWPLVACFVGHPIVLSLGALGSPGILLAFTALGAAWALMRWARAEGFRDLLTCSLFLTAAVLTRYDAIWLVITATAYVAWRTRKEGWARMEGTLIAFLLPLGYCALVWVGANWAIMGDPWHFWRLTVAHETVAVNWLAWVGAIAAVTVLCCPPVVGLAFHEVRRRGNGIPGPPSGRPGAWLILGAGTGAALTPAWLSGVGSSVWTQLQSFGVIVTCVGLALIAPVLGVYLRGASASRRGPVLASSLLVVVGIVLAGWLTLAKGTGLPVSPLEVLTGTPAFAVDVQAEHQAGQAIADSLEPQSKVYLLGGPRFAVSLFAGRPPQTRYHEVEDIASLPLQAGDLLALNSDIGPEAFRSALESKCLRAVPLVGDTDSPWRVRRLERIR